MTEDLSNDLNDQVSKMSMSHNMAEMVSYHIFGAAVTTTRAFEKVSIKVDPSINRVFISIKLRWWAKSKRLEKLHAAWLNRAERRCQEHVPENWKLLVYYEREKT